MTGMSQVQLDRYTSSSYTTVSGTASNGGLIRLTVASTSAFTTGDKAYVFSVDGTTEANGFWTVTVINSTTLDLQSSTYTNAYTSGGRVQTAGTWTKPSWASAVRLIMIGGGGSGGSGYKNGAGASTAAGGGGGGGGCLDITLAASQFSSTETYSVAASVAGGIASTINESAGTAGIQGNITSFSVNTIGTLIAYAGGGGYFGQNANVGGGGGAGLSGSGGNGGSNSAGTAGANNGGAGGNSSSGVTGNTSIQGGGAGGGGNAVSGGTGVSGGFAVFGAGGGGAGGNKNAGGSNNGGSGGASRYIAGATGGTSNGTSITVNGTNGTAGTGGQPGSGGGGGAASNGANSVTKAGNGGNGGTPGGGGGGGGTGTNNVTNGGDGGDGARGEIWVISYEVDPSSTVGFGSFFG